MNGVKNGYELPENITEEEYYYIRDHKDEDPILTGFTGFSCSFGAKWFGGYARSSTGRNYTIEAKRSFLKNLSFYQNATFICSDYRDVELPEGCVVYADPPYDGTTGYRNQAFDSNAFWEYMRTISQEHMVYISEQNAPDDFESIWQQPLLRTLDRNKSNYFEAVEKLYVYKPTLELLKTQEE